MEKEPHTEPAIEHEEICVLLRSLRIEATPEAHFEERFVYDFRERLVREAVCRPARALVWEHLLQVLSNLGGRRLAWSLSSFGVGALCMGVLFWQLNGAGRRALASQAWEFGGTAALRPGSVQDVVCTSVSHAKRKAYTDRLMAARLSEPSYLAVDEEREAQFQYFDPTATESDGLGVSVSGMMPGMAR